MQDHILIVDDDLQETSFLERFFTKNGYRSTGVATAAGMFDVINQTPVDLIVLDLILPDEDGLDAAKRLQRSNDTPIIMLSARDEVFDRIVGLELGADDYLTKPYEPRELLARVRSVLRRYKKGPPHDIAPAQSLLTFDDLHIDMDARTARRSSDGEALGLTDMEFSLLQAILRAQGDVVTREDLLDLLYGDSVSVTDRAIDAHIVRLRRKLGTTQGGKDLVITAHGVGYRLGRKPAQNV